MTRKTTWYTAAWAHMTGIQSATAPGADLGKAIDDSYPWQRSGWPYKAWLAARRDFFRKNNIPLRRAKKPCSDLFS